MNDPYKVLEIDREASDEEVRASYLKLEKKYHPDNYDDGQLKELAKEKTKEITEAFDTIMNERRINRVKSKEEDVIVNEEGEKVNDNKNSKRDFPYIRDLIQQNRLIEAEESLDNIELDKRSAEWYFLKGSIFFSKGYLDDAGNFFSTALRMDPNNNEYKAALNKLSWQRQGNFGSPYQGGYRQPNQPIGGCGACDICTGMLCADCCCECCGGDCIRGC